MRMRRTWPSTVGLNPRLALRIALSTAPTIDLSQTWTESMRGSGTLIVATWLMGMCEPYASTLTGSIKLAEARPVRRPPSS